MKSKATRRLIHDLMTFFLLPAIGAVDKYLGLMTTVYKDGLTKAERKYLQQTKKDFQATKERVHIIYARTKRSHAGK